MNVRVRAPFQTDTVIKLTIGVSYKGIKMVIYDLGQLTPIWAI